MTIAKVETHKERRARYGTIGLSALVLATITTAALWNQLHLQPFEFVTTVSAQSTVKSLPQEASQGLHIALEPRMGDLDAMIKRREIRALVVYSRSGFFYDQGQPKGISYEALQEFQRLLNLKLKTGNLPVTVTFLPVQYAQLEEYLTKGFGDLIAVPVAVTPERLQKAAFSTPIITNVKQVVATGPGGPVVQNLENLSGKTVFVNPLTVYYQNLQELNKSLESKGKKPVILKAADKNLGDEDLLEMVNAGLVPATVTTDFKAAFWAKIFTQLRVCSKCELSTGETLAWAMRKDSPELKRSVDEFVEGHREGTAFGNTLLRRYLQNTKWATDATSKEDLQKFNAYVQFFKKNAMEYDFDYLMLMALSYQESGLDQDRKNPSGAEGIMQVIPKLAAASPINVPSVDSPEDNIRAGTKMLRSIEDTYFKDENLDPLNKTLLTFASYNAGPNRIAILRKKAASEGLNPNEWFGNVEFLVAKDIGQETVRYVSNIFKYYVAYKLITEEEEERQKGLKSP
jgi:membrane-bound lytic murein transglycosylase MltF